MGSVSSGQGIVYEQVKDGGEVFNHMALCMYRGIYVLKLLREEAYVFKDSDIAVFHRANRVIRY
jgi:hypothetical protein